MTAFVLAHLSDPHLPPLPVARLRELAGKRAFGYLNWTRNRHAVHRREVLDLLVSDMQAQRPDHIAITGDITNLALHAEFAPARAWLESVGPSDDVTVVPGNHDAYVRATRHRFADEFGAYLRDDNAPAGNAITFPVVRRRGPLALVAVSTAVPTAPLMATGRLGPTQRDALAHALTQLASERRFRVVLIHHPLHLEHRGRFKRLTDSAQLRTILKRCGAELILHGHDHIHSTEWIDGPAGGIPAIGVPSASAIGHGHHAAAAYNLFAIEREGDTWRCDQRVRGLTQAQNIHDIRTVQLA